MFHSGYSVIEILLVLAASILGIALGLPTMNEYVSTQRLNNAISIVSTYVQSAKSLSHSTGCGSELFLAANATGGVSVAFKLLHSNDNAACARWFEANNQQGSAVLIQSSAIDNLMIDRDWTIRFLGISGGVENSSINTALLSSHGKSAQVNIQTFGHLTFKYGS